MSTVNNFNVEILEKGRDWDPVKVATTGTSAPDLIVNGQIFGLHKVQSSSGSGIDIIYSGSIQISEISRLIDVTVYITEASIDNPEITWVEDITDSIYSIDLNSGDSLNLNSGQEFLCQATGKKDGSTYDAGTYSWKSEDTSIATVDQTGKIVSVGYGSTVVQVFWEVDGICVYHYIDVNVGEPQE